MYIHQRSEKMFISCLKQTWHCDQPLPLTLSLWNGLILKDARVIIVHFYESIYWLCGVNQSHSNCEGNALTFCSWPRAWRSRRVWAAFAPGSPSTRTWGSTSLRPRGICPSGTDETSSLQLSVWVSAKQRAKELVVISESKTRTVKNICEIEK